jgi:hypothetical protein
MDKNETTTSPETVKNPIPAINTFEKLSSAPDRFPTLGGSHHAESEEFPGNKDIVIMGKRVAIEKDGSVVVLGERKTGKLFE